MPEGCTRGICSSRDGDAAVSPACGRVGSAHRALLCTLATRQPHLACQHRPVEVAAQNAAAECGCGDQRARRATIRVVHQIVAPHAREVGHDESELRIERRGANIVALPQVEARGEVARAPRDDTPKRVARRHGRRVARLDNEQEAMLRLLEANLAAGR
eukprot:3611071-Prymnesium_polylepis.1